MKTLLIHVDGEPPPEVREIIQAGSTEVREASELRQEAAADADRVVIWRRGEVELRGAGDTQGVAAEKLSWPDDEEKLRLFFQTAG